MSSPCPACEARQKLAQILSLKHKVKIIMDAAYIGKHVTDSINSDFNQVYAGLKAELEKAAWKICPEKGYEND